MEAIFVGIPFTHPSNQFTVMVNWIVSYDIKQLTSISANQFNALVVVITRSNSFQFIRTVAGRAKNPANRYIFIIY